MRRLVYACTTLGFTCRLIAAIGLLAAFSLPASAAGGLFGSVTSLTEPTPTANDKFGSAWNSGTILSADGKTALVSADTVAVGTATSAGKVFIYQYANGQWTLAKEIDDPDATASDNFGADIALNADGTAALIGSAAAVNGQAGAGKAYLYTLTNGSWTLAHEFDDPATTAGDNFGYSGTALSANGQTAAIGAFQTTVNGQADAGEVYIYSESNGTWSQAAAIPDPDNTAGDDFADTVAMSGDGQSVLIGSGAAVNGQSFSGKAYLYTLISGSWTKSHEFDDPLAGADDAFGYNFVALSTDGLTAVISACGTTVNGLAEAGEGYIFSESNGTWNQTAAIPDPDNAAGDCFSFPLAVSGDGTTALFGSSAAVNGQTDAGKAYLYTLTNSTWTQSKEFDDPAAAADDNFGASGVALSADGEAAFMGAYGTTVNSLSDAGEAYLYQSPDDVSLSLSASPAGVTTGQNVTLDATITNTDSAVTAYNVVLTGTLPPGLTYASSSAAGGTCTASGLTVTCVLASLAPGAVWQPTIMGSASSTGTLTASATVASNEPDPTSSNNSASASVIVTAAVTPPSSGGGAFGLMGLLMLGLPLLGRRRRK